MPIFANPETIFSGLLPTSEIKNLQTPTFGARTSRFSILAEIAVKN